MPILISKCRLPTQRNGTAGSPESPYRFPVGKCSMLINGGRFRKVRGENLQFIIADDTGLRRIRTPVAPQIGKPTAPHETQSSPHVSNDAENILRMSQGKRDCADFPPRIRAAHAPRTQSHRMLVSSDADIFIACHNSRSLPRLGHPARMRLAQKRPLAVMETVRRRW